MPSQEGLCLAFRDGNFKALDPKPAKLVHDHSGGFTTGRLFIESQLRQA